MDAKEERRLQRQIERRVREVDKVLTECQRRQIDPIKTLQREVKRHDAHKPETR